MSRFPVFHRNEKKQLVSKSFLIRKTTYGFCTNILSTGDEAWQRTEISSLSEIWTDTQNRLLTDCFTLFEISKLRETFAVNDFAVSAACLSFRSSIKTAGLGPEYKHCVSRKLTTLHLESTEGLWHSHLNNRHIKGFLRPKRMTPMDRYT